MRAQEEWRALDRLVGYTLSSAVSSAVGVSRLWAGPVNPFGARLKLANGGAVEWRTDPWLPEGTLYVLDRALAERVALTCKLKWLVTASRMTRERHVRFCGRLEACAI
ncbi:hypothetical protein BI364_12480 [Acidihalobacter yilgarnensis]|uniref:Uncharacterized protein n=1 Tax=Acidihalobacter yilgarnensis TaxID=2819280 RepID=A0A1D8IQ86_9GAMM|nr:hypothetical protein BI364_12480 [Acidihalobacter yilgarnensis]